MPDFSDPVLLVLCAIGVIFVASYFSKAAQLERKKQDTALKQEEYAQTVLEGDADFARKAKAPVDIERDLLLRQGIEKIRVGGLAEESKIRVIETITIDGNTTEQQINFKKAESQIHIDELTAEDAAALQAARQWDAYEREKNRGGAKARGRQDTVPSGNGSGPRGSEQASGPAGGNKKASSRFRKSKPADENSGVQQEDEPPDSAV